MVQQMRPKHQGINVKSGDYHNIPQTVNGVYIYINITHSPNPLAGSSRNQPSGFFITCTSLQFVKRTSYLMLTLLERLQSIAFSYLIKKKLVLTQFSLIVTTCYLPTSDFLRGYQNTHASIQKMYCMNDKLVRHYAFLELLNLTCTSPSLQGMKSGVLHSCASSVRHMGLWWKALRSTYVICLWLERLEIT